MCRAALWVCACLSVGFTVSTQLFFTCLFACEATHAGGIKHAAVVVRAPEPGCPEHQHNDQHFFWELLHWVTSSLWISFIL